MPINKGDSISCVATKDIRPGEEVTLAYFGEFECMLSQARHKLLYFVCKCKACLPGTAFHQASQLRRQLIRGLHYLTLGMDLGQENPKAPSRIIADPKLREDAKGLRIPLSSRFFYDTFTVLLLEEEGLLGERTIMSFNARLELTKSRFQSKQSSEIAARALKRDTSSKGHYFAYSRLKESH